MMRRKTSRSNSLASPPTSTPLIHAILESAVSVISRPVSDFSQSARIGGLGGKDINEISQGGGIWPTSQEES
jgi:hypothetical protein